MIEKKNYYNQLQTFYENRKQKKYYGTTEVMEKTGISLRTLRYRLSNLKEKYKEVPALLYKENNVWFIHRQLLEEFLPKIRRNKTLYNMGWNSFITWATIDSFDNAYHDQLATEIKFCFPHGNFDYVIEKTKNDVNHVHMVTDLPVSELEETIDQIINKYLPKKEYRLQVEQVQSKALSRNYFNK